MGIKGLVQWAKNVHPDAIKSFPQRWTAPEIRGKRVAIDATLMTNRFHFAQLKSPLGPKSGLIGWYHLINGMRSAGMQPIAVWDAPGHRAWKEPEAKKRTLSRAEKLARMSFEEERSDRLSDLRRVLLEYEALSPTRQEEARLATVELVENAAHVTTPASSSDTGDSLQQRPATESATTEQAASEQPSPLPQTDAKQDTADSAGLHQQLASLIERHRDYAHRAGLKEAPSLDVVASPDVSDAIDHVRELEELHEELDIARPISTAAKPAADGHRLSASEITSLEKARRELDQKIVDEKIIEMIPMDTFVESRTQRSLTIEEGHILDAVLSPPLVETSSSAVTPPLEGLQELDALPGWEAIEPEAEMTPLARLDQLVERAPVVRDIYVRALNQPTLSNHAACRDLLRLMGVPIVLAEAPFEAEGLASAMANQGLVDFVGTEDSDVLAYQAPMLRNVSTVKLPLMLIEGSDLQHRSGLSLPSFIDFCILLGTDASPRLHRVGPVAAYRLIQKHGSIEEILANEPEIAGKAPEGWMDMAYNARELFASVPAMPDEADLQQREWSPEEVEKWLVEEHGFGFEDDEPNAWPDGVETPLGGNIAWELGVLSDAESPAFNWDEIPRNVR